VIRRKSKVLFPRNLIGISGRSCPAPRRGWNLWTSRK